MQQLANKKINSLTESELISLAQDNGYTLDLMQAKSILRIVHAQKVDVGNKAQIHHIIHRLKTETDPRIAHIVSELFQQYGHYLG